MQAEAAAERGRKDDARRSELAARAETIATELAQVLEAFGGSVPDIEDARRFHR